MEDFTKNLQKTLDALYKDINRHLKTLKSKKEVQTFMAKEVRPTVKKFAEKLGLYAYYWPMSAVGTGVIYYQRTNEPNCILVGSAHRASVVGEGYGISSGGFAELLRIYKLALRMLRTKTSLSTIFPVVEEAERENWEELPGIRKIISKKAYIKRARYLTAFLVPKADDNRIHCTLYHCMEISSGERLAISALPPSNETKEPLDFFKLRWNDKGEITLEIPSKLYHEHEMIAFKALADKVRMEMMFEKKLAA